MRPLPTSLAVITASLLLLANTAPATHADILLSDTTFNNTDWSTTVYSVNGGATNGATQSLSGGNPGAYRAMTHTLPESSNTGVFHQYLPVSYTPSVSGAILSLDYREDRIEFNPPFQGAAIGSNPALLQNGIVYSAPSFASFTNTTWNTVQRLNLTAADFRLAGNPLANPDFSNTGGTIFFGYNRSNSNTGNRPITTSHGIDNWSVSLRTGAAPEPAAPEPGTLALLGMGLVPVAGAMIRRRRSIRKA